jgi:hypothetical protein
MDTNERETAVFIQELGLETALRTRIPPEIDSRVRVKLTRAVVAMRDIGFELSD